MWRIIDTKTNKEVGRNTIRINAERRCALLNFRNCGPEELEKEESERRFIFKCD